MSVVQQAQAPARIATNDMYLSMEEMYFSPHHALEQQHQHHHQQQQQQKPVATSQHQPQDIMGGDAAARSSFPEKLHGLIMDAETMGFQDVVSWQDSGKSFKVHKPQIFQNDIIPKYFKPIKYTSFQRQLSIYGFQRIRTGWNTGGYEHPYFTRENPTTCKNIRRHQKPTIFASKPTAVIPVPVASTSSPPLYARSQSPMTSIDEDLFNMYGEDVDPIDAALAQMKNEINIEHHDFEPLPLGSTCLPRVSSHNSMMMMNHHHHPAAAAQHPQSHHAGHHQAHYHNDDQFMLDKLQSVFQEDMLHEHHHHHHGTCAPANVIENPLKAVETQAVAQQTNNNNNNKGAFFPAKLHQLLDDAERMNFRHIVSWVDNGRAFQIHDQKEFVGKIMSIYFDQSKFASFRRQLNLYGFNRTRTNNNKNMYFHENFVQGNSELCEQMVRRCSGGASNPKPTPTVASFAA